MKKFVAMLSLVISMAGAAAMAEPCQSFSAPVSMKAEFKDLQITHELKGTYQSDCRNIRFDFFAEDPDYPTDVSVIVNATEKKLFVISHQSKSYFTQPWDEKKLKDIHEVILPFQKIFSDSKKRKFVGEKKIAGTNCKVFSFVTPQGQGKVCLDKEHEDWPLEIEAALEDGSTLKQSIGPYKKENISAKVFGLPDGYKKEDYSVSELFSLFLQDQPPLPLP